MIHDNDNFALMSFKDACAFTSMSKTMVRRLWLEGKFPRPVELGEKRIAFRREVTGWVQSKVQARAA